MLIESTCGFSAPGKRDGTQPALPGVGSGFVTNNGDCVDSNYNINPAADERCNGYDDNCDGAVDGSDSVDASYGYEDADGDSFGNPDSYGLYCDVSSNNLDCDDAAASEPQVVDSASSSTSTDGTATNPWYYIQDGIDAANECVLVRAGLYGENLDFGGKDVLVFSEEGANATFIDGGHAGAVVTFANGEGSGAELRGFTLTNGTGHAESSTSTRSCGSSVTCTDHYYTVCGGGVYLDGATPTLSELVITGNDLSVPADYVSTNDYYYFYSFGGGMCVRNATVAMAHVTFSENTAEDGGAVYVESTGGVTFNQVGMIGNTSDFGGGVEVDGGSFTATNALLAWNDAATSGGGLYLVDATVNLTNVTVGECDAATSGGGIEATGASTLTMKNSIVYGANTMEGILMATTSTYSGTYSDVYGNVGGNYSGTSDPTGSRGNISSNPNFSSVTDDGNNGNDIWTLASGSACVDAGDTLGIYNDPDGTRNNMGAYGGPGGTW